MSITVESRTPAIVLQERVAPAILERMLVATAVALVRAHCGGTLVSWSPGSHSHPATRPTRSCSRMAGCGCGRGRWRWRSYELPVQTHANRLRYQFQTRHPQFQVLSHLLFPNNLYTVWKRNAKVQLFSRSPVLLSLRPLRRFIGLSLLCRPRNLHGHLLPSSTTCKPSPVCWSLALIPFLQLPQSHMTLRPRLIEMPIRLPGFQPRATQVAEMGIALKTYHVVAAVRFLHG